MNNNNILDVANFFLSQHDSKMTHKKLQKLCYYAKAWSMALRDEELFSEHFEAWVHGPVSPVLYREFKANGWQVIPATNAPTTLSDEELELLNEVYSTYGYFSGDELESLTHSEAPWIDARGACNPYEPSQEVIDNVVIRDYYLKVFEEAQND